MQRFLAALFFMLIPGVTTAEVTPPDSAQTIEETKSDRPSVSSEQSAAQINPARFGMVVDEAFGAFQRGLYLTAYKLALPRAEEGDPAAQTLLAEIYSKGLGIKKDLVEATKWYGRAAEAGNHEAQLQYALLLNDGDIVERDTQKAHDLMAKAAAAGLPMAQFNLAQMMTRGGHVNEEAAQWYLKAAQAGLADAQYAMAQILVQGLGGYAIDEKAAHDWMMQAAQQGFDSAQLELATWLVTGRVGERKPQEGFRWMERAAQGGNIAARNRLAKLYAAGIGTEPDVLHAASWYLSARKAGLVDPEMEDFLAGLADDQIAEANKMVNMLQ